EATTDVARAALASAPYTLTYAPEKGSPKSWTLDASTLAKLLTPSADPDLPVTVDAEAFASFVDGIAKQIEIPAQNARFQIENGRVTEFVGSEQGLAIDRDALAGALTQALNGEEKTVALTVLLSEPAVTTDEVNNLGVSEILGVGTSNYAGSPTNRIKNIRN